MKKNSFLARKIFTWAKETMETAPVRSDKVVAAERYDLATAILAKKKVQKFMSKNIFYNIQNFQHSKRNFES